MHFALLRVVRRVFQGCLGDVHSLEVRVHGEVCIHPKVVWLIHRHVVLWVELVVRDERLRTEVAWLGIEVPSSVAIAT